MEIGCRSRLRRSWRPTSDDWTEGAKKMCVGDNGIVANQQIVLMKLDVLISLGLLTKIPIALKKRGSVDDPAVNRGHHRS